MGQNLSSKDIFDQREDNRHVGHTINAPASSSYSNNTNKTSTAQTSTQQQNLHIGGRNYVGGNSITLIVGDNYAPVNTGGIQAIYTGGIMVTDQNVTSTQATSNAQTSTATAGHAGYNGTNRDIHARRGRG